MQPATDSAPVAISVIIPVRNRKDLLARTLESLDAQTRRDFEVIVVDDGSTDGADQLAEAAVIAGRPVRLLRAFGAGAVTARGIGTQEARGDILAFTDSDCFPSPRWLELGAAAIEDGADLVNGLTLAARPLAPFERTMESGTEGLYATANMFFRRSAFDEIGGFDVATAGRLGFRHNERARGTGFGEDTIVAWSMIRAGYRADYVPEAEVRHHVFPPDLKESVSRAWQTAAFPQLVVEVPELRSTIIHHRVFFGNHRRLPFYVTVAALLTGRRRLVGLSLAWWALARLNEMRRMPYPWRRKLPMLPAEMLTDAVSGTAMTIGSAKSKTLVL